MLGRGDLLRPPTAVYVETGVDEGIVLSDAITSTSFVLSRDVANPFHDASFVYLPYCTGDLHAGRRVATYGGRALHHWGAENVDRVLARLTTTFPAPGRITLVGVSAGGYGVSLDWWRVARAFPGVRVDVLADSSPLIDPLPALWATWSASWAIEMPPDCADCAEGFSRLLPHYASAMPAESRYGLLAYTEDQVIAAYFGIDGAAVQSGIEAMRTGTATTSAQRSFVAAGDQHVLLAMPGLEAGGVSVGAWIIGFASDDSAWDDVGP